MKLHAIHFVPLPILALASCRSTVPHVVEARPSASHPGHLAIESKAKWNNTGIHLREGCRYRFEVCGTWTDWFMKCDACGPVSPWLRAIMAPLKPTLRFPPCRDSRAHFFSLVGTISRTDSDALPQHAFLIHDGLLLPAPATGVLHAFANDSPGHYGNNRGRLDLRVTEE